MGANLSVQDTSKAHSSYHHYHCHCCRCCGRKRRRETKRRGDAPLDQLILAAVDYIRAEMQNRGGRREDGRVRAEEREKREGIWKGKGSMKDASDDGSDIRGQRREKTPRREHEKVDAQSQQRKTEREDEPSQRQPSEQLQLHEDVQPAEIPIPIALRQESVQSIQPDPTPSPIPQQSRRTSRAIDQAQATGMEPLPPPIHRQVNRSREFFFSPLILAPSLTDLIQKHLSRL